MTPEAMLLSAFDDLKDKFETLRNAFTDATTAGHSPSETTDLVRSVDRNIFNSKDWLEST